MSLSRLLDLLWEVARGRAADINSPDFVQIYAALAAIIFAILWFKVFAKEGIDVASGAKTELPKILIKWGLVALMVMMYGSLADSIWHGVVHLAEWFFPNTNQLLETMNIAMTRMSEAKTAEAQIKDILAAILKGQTGVLLLEMIINGLLVIIGMLILFVCYMLIIINIAGSLAILAMNLVIAPVFFALAFDRDFRAPAVSWFSAVLSYVLMMPLYGLVIRMCAAIVGAGMTTNPIGFVSMEQIAAQLVGPFMALGIVFSANKVVSALVGGAAGGGLGSSVLGGAMATGGLVSGFLPGGGMLKATGAAAGAAAKSATSGGGTSGGTSATTRAARGGI